MNLPKSIARAGRRDALLGRLGGLWRHRDFMYLWAGQSISVVGSTMTREALPITAMLLLHATPLQMGLLGAAASAPTLLLGLLAGVWIDRVRRRPLMQAADLGRAALLLSIPLAALLGWLSIEQLYLVALLTGVLTVFFDVACGALVASLLGRDHVVEGNSKLGVSSALAEVASPPAGGLLVQWLGGPATLVLDALSFVFSAWTLTRLRDTEQPQPVTQQPDIRRELAEGVRLVIGHPLLRPIAVSSAIRNFFGWFFGAIYGLYVIRELGLSPTALGLAVAAGGVGGLGGALLVAPLTRWLGLGPATAGGLLVGALASGLTWLASGAGLPALLLLVMAQLIGDAANTAAMINQVSLTQAITPERYQGRVQASMRVVGEGVGTLGLLVGGLLGELIGLPATVGLAVLGLLLGSVWLAISPLARLRGLPAQADNHTPAGQAD